MRIQDYNPLLTIYTSYFLYNIVSTAPQQFNISANPNTGAISILNWEQPTNLNGIFMHYNILIATTSNSSRAEVVATTNDTTFDLSMLDIEAGTYYVWVSSLLDYMSE